MLEIMSNNPGTTLIVAILLVSAAAAIAAVITGTEPDTKDEDEEQIRAITNGKKPDNDDKANRVTAYNWLGDAEYFDLTVSDDQRSAM